MASRSKSFLAFVIAGGLGAVSVGIVQAAIADRAANMAVAVRLDDDQYPHMRRALHDLRAARESLSQAEDVFKDHREKALDHVDKAIEECQEALQGG